MSVVNAWKHNRFGKKALGAVALALVAGLGAGLRAQADGSGKTPGFTPFDHFEFSEERGIYELRETDSPFLGGDVEMLGTFEIHKVTLKQVTSALFKTKTRDLGDLCRRDPSTLEEIDRKTAERSCGARVWAYKVNDQIFLFKADRELVEREDRLDVFPFESTSWDRRTSVRAALSGLASSRVMRAFAVPREEIARHSDLRRMAQSSRLYAFSGAVEPGQVLNTQAAAFAWNAAFVIFGATLNPSYVVQVPKNQNVLDRMKITQTESVSVLLMGNSTFTTEYHLRKAE